MAQYSDSDVLVELLCILHERQSYCPCCGGEVVCDEGCMLEDRWFEKKTNIEVNNNHAKPHM